MQTAIYYNICNYKNCKCRRRMQLHECNWCYNLYCKLNKLFICRDCAMVDAQMVKNTTTANKKNIYYSI